MQCAVDLGLSNMDVAVGNAADGQIARLLTVPGHPQAGVEEVTRALELGGYQPRDFEHICVTGGRHHLLPDAIEGVPVVKVNEIAAIGCGGAWLSRQAWPHLDAALIVSAGSGTAMVVARGGAFRHVTGSAVGGGTLLGLGRLLLGLGDPQTLDALAQRGNSSRVDLTLAEAIGSALDWLPADATAVNFGKAALPSAAFEPQDLAAALVTLVGQVIGVIAANAARAEGLHDIVVVGHLVDMASVRAVLQAVADLYRLRLHIPPNPGYATAIGALLHGVLC